MNISEKLREFFQKNLPWVLENIDGDNGLSVEQKLAFFEHLDSLSEEYIHDEAKTFCYRNQLIGEESKVDRNIVFGRLVSESSLVDVFTRYMGVTAEAAQALLDFYYLYNTQDDIDSLKSDLVGVPMSEYLMWSYLNDSGLKSSLSDIDLEHISCQLGVELSGNGVLFGHRIPKDIEIRRPTFFDSAMDRHWLPGGKTSPLKPCSGHKNGLDEFVHSPNKFDHLESLFIEV